MVWKLTEDRPIWIQLVDQLTRHIVSGVYAPGAVMPTVRTLASEAGVNPNTMQRALAELENRSLVETNRRTGRLVTEDLSLIHKVREELAYDIISGFLASMGALGYTREQTRELLAACSKTEGDNS